MDMLRVRSKRQAGECISLRSARRQDLDIKPHDEIGGCWICTFDLHEAFCTDGLIAASRSVDEWRIISSPGGNRISLGRVTSGRRAYALGNGNSQETDRTLGGFLVHSSFSFSIRIAVYGLSPCLCPFVSHFIEGSI